MVSQTRYWWPCRRPRRRARRAPSLCASSPVTRSSRPWPSTVSTISSVSRSSSVLAKSFCYQSCAPFLWKLNAKRTSVSFSRSTSSAGTGSIQTGKRKYAPPEPPPPLDRWEIEPKYTNDADVGDISPQGADPHPPPPPSAAKAGGNHLKSKLSPSFPLG